MLPRFDADVAYALGQRVRELAVARHLAIVVEVRRFSQPLYYSALAGTTPDHVEWVRRKGNVCARFHKSSYAVGLSLAAKGESLESAYALAHHDFAAHGGSVPLAVAGAGVVGCITVSGLPQRQDHELAVEALCLHLGIDYAGLALTPS